MTQEISPPPPLNIYLDDRTYRVLGLQGLACVVGGLCVLVYAPGAGFDGTIMILGIALTLLVFGGVFIVRAGNGLMEPKPVFEGEPEGFRIRGGRLRRWSCFYGVLVFDQRSNGVKLGEVVSVRVGPFHELIDFLYRRRVGVASGHGEGQAIADQIWTYKNQLDGYWLKADVRMDLGAAPVVAARDRAHRMPDFE